MLFIYINNMVVYIYIFSVTVKFNVNDSLEEDVHAEAAEPPVADHNHVQLGPVRI